MKVNLFFMLFYCCTISVFSSSQSSQDLEINHAQRGKILVVYYSRTGVTRGIAKEIASKLNADIDEIIDKKNRSGVFGFLESAESAKKGELTELEEMKRNPHEYHLVIIGTPIWSGTMSTPVRTYLLKFKNSLPENIAFFTTSRMTAADTVVKEMEKIIGKPACSYTGFSSFPQYFRDKNSKAFTGDLSKEHKDSIIQVFVNSLKQSDPGNINKE